MLAPRYLNVALSNLSPDKKWFLDEIGDGPVPMAMFSKPFHELGGVFIDYKANRARTLTIRNSVGIQVISAADGSKKAIPIPAGARVSNATWSPDGSLDRLLRPHGRRDAHLGDGPRDATSHGSSRRGRCSRRSSTTFEFTKDGKQIAAVHRSRRPRADARRPRRHLPGRR